MSCLPSWLVLLLPAPFLQAPVPPGDDKAAAAAAQAAGMPPGMPPGMPMPFFAPPGPFFANPMAMQVRMVYEQRVGMVYLNRGVPESCSKPGMDAARHGARLGFGSNGRALGSACLLRQPCMPPFSLE